MKRWTVKLYSREIRRKDIDQYVENVDNMAIECEELDRQLKELQKGMRNIRNRMGSWAKNQSTVLAQCFGCGKRSLDGRKRNLETHVAGGAGPWDLIGLKRSMYRLLRAGEEWYFGGTSLKVICCRKCFSSKRYKLSGSRKGVWLHGWLPTRPTMHDMAQKLVCCICSKVWIHGGAFRSLIQYYYHSLEIPRNPGSIAQTHHEIGRGIYDWVYAM